MPHEKSFMLFCQDRQNLSLKYVPLSLLRAPQCLTYGNSCRSSKTGAMSTVTTTRTLSMITIPYISKSSKETQYGIVTTSTGKPYPKTSPVLF